MMRQNRLRCWKNPEDVGRRMPEQVIQLTEVYTYISSHQIVTFTTLTLSQDCLLPSRINFGNLCIVCIVYIFTLNLCVCVQDMVVEPAPRLLMRRPNTIYLKNAVSELYMAFESKEEREEWIEKLSRALLDLRVWKSSCDFLIPQPNSKFYMDSPSTHFVPKLTAGDVRGSSSLTQL